VIHSDVKPSNIFITTAGKAKVLDFGIARAVRGSRHYDPAALGALTPAYASCEMLERHTPDVRDDVYAVACVLYELLTGKHPFSGRSAVKARNERARVAPIPGLSRTQNAALTKALAFSRDRRTASVEGLLKGLEDVAGRRLRALMGTSAVAAVLVALSVAGWFGYSTLQQQEVDAAFVDSLLKPNVPRAEGYDPQTVNDLLEQGDDYLHQARGKFDPALLSEGVSTAYGAYLSVLRLDAANRRAAEGALEVLRLYQSKAIELAREQQYKRALELVGIALRIDPANRQLKVMKDDLALKAMLGSS
jgi:serine/threonine protein kinase